MAAATTPKPGSRSFGARMTAKVGPLPVWTWALLILVVGYLLYRTSSGSSSSSDAPSSSPDTTPSTDPGTSGTPGPDGTGTTDTQTGVNDQILSQLSGFQGSVDALTAAVLSSEAFQPGAGDAGSGSSVPNGATPATPKQVADAKAAAAAKHKPAATHKPKPKPAAKPKHVAKSKPKARPAPTLISEHGKGGGYR